LDAVLQQQRVQLFFCTGEHMDEFEAFETKSFVSHLLSMGDWSAFVDKIDEVVPMDQQSELMQN
jgi:signal recognition particle subunit SRP54